MIREHYSGDPDPYRLPYIVLFRHSIPNPAFTAKFVFIDNGESLSNATWPHGLDRTLNSQVLDAIWYCLHLPRTLFDTIDVSPNEVRRTAHLDCPHEVILLPIDMLQREDFRVSVNSACPVVVLYPDGAAEDAAHIEARLPPVSFSQLNPSILQSHWQAISVFPIPIGRRRTTTPPPWTPRSVVAPLVLPSAHFTQRAFLRNGHYPENIGLESIGSAFEYSLNQRKALNVLAEATAGIDHNFSGEKLVVRIEEEKRKSLPPAQWSVVIGMTGVSPSFRRIAHGNSANDADAAHEAHAMQVIVTHRAAASNGLGILRPEVDDESFRFLAQLEDHCASVNPQPFVVRKLLGKIGSSISNTLGTEGIRLIKGSSRITAFTNFPIGLAILPGNSAPLSCCVPVSLLPAQPLTRCLQHEMLRRPIVYLRKNLRVLVAECLHPTDPIRPISMQGWMMVQEMVQEHPGTTCDILEVSSPRQLHDYLSSGNYQVLILSAHGHYDKAKNVSALVIGDQRVIGPELGAMPPLVILSACHTAPRGRGSVGVADLLLAGGASAILASLVAIDVRKNALLMVRLFTYIMETIRGNEHHRAIDEIWHRVASSNAVNEVLSASKRIQRWAMQGSDERSVITEFMLKRSPGNLRLRHIYQDTEAILQQLAQERGLGEHFRSTMRSQGYLPESILYTLLGRPDRVVVADDTLDQMIPKEGGQT